MKAKYQLAPVARAHLKQCIDDIRQQQEHVVDRMEQLFLMECGYSDTELSTALTEIQTLIGDLNHHTLVSSFSFERIWVHGVEDSADFRLH